MNMYMYVSVYVYEICNMCICLRVCVCIVMMRNYVWLCICIWIYFCMYLCMSVRRPVCLYVCGPVDASWRLQLQIHLRQLIWAVQRYTIYFSTATKNLGLCQGISLLTLALLIIYDFKDWRSRSIMQCFPIQVKTVQLKANAVSQNEFNKLDKNEYSNREI